LEAKELLTARKDLKEMLSAMRTGVQIKGSDQVFDFLPSSHEWQPGKKIKFYGYDK
jgi:hypothetical protein